MGAQKVQENQPSRRWQKPQLACRHDGLHASCTISEICDFYKMLFLKGFIVLQELAQRLQYPC